MLNTASRTGPCCLEARAAEQERTILMASIIEVVHHDDVPQDVREAALTLVGWLARRLDSEKPCTRGVLEARRQLIAVGGVKG